MAPPKAPQQNLDAACLQHAGPILKRLLPAGRSQCAARWHTNLKPRQGKSLDVVCSRARSICKTDPPEALRYIYIYIYIERKQQDGMLTLSQYTWHRQCLNTTAGWFLTAPDENGHVVCNRFELSNGGQRVYHPLPSCGP